MRHAALVDARLLSGSLFLGNPEQIWHMNAGGTEPEWTSALADLTTIESSGAADLDSGGAGSSFGGALLVAGTLTLPSADAPTVPSADGELFIDNLVTDWSTGIVNIFASGELQGVVMMPIIEFTTPLQGAVPTYNETNDEFEMVVPSGGGGLNNVVEDLTPQLGGDLDTNGKDLTGTGQILLTGTDPNSLVSLALTASAPSTPVAQTLYEDSIVKVWARITNSGTPSIDDDLNVSSVTNTGTGLTTINFARDMGNVTYSVVSTMIAATSERSILATTFETYSVLIRTFNAAGDLSDISFSLIIIGNN